MGMELVLGPPPADEDTVAWRIRLQALAELRALNEPRDVPDDPRDDDVVVVIP